MTRNQLSMITRAARIAVPAIGLAAISLALPHPALAADTSVADPVAALGLNTTGFNMNQIAGIVTGPLALLTAGGAALFGVGRAKQSNFDLHEMMHSGAGVAFSVAILGGVGYAWNRMHQSATGALLPVAHHASIVAIHAHALVH